MSRPSILILGLLEEDYLSSLFENLISSMRQVASCEYATRANDAKNVLARDPPPTAVLSIDAGPTMSKYRSLNEQLVRYARAGGIVVFGGNFSNHFAFNTATAFFGAWGVPWTLGDYHRTTVYLNRNGVPGMNLAGLESSYSVKALNLADVAPDSVVYSPSLDSLTQSHVFAPTSVDISQAPAAFTKVGSGYMGYTGDVNAEHPTTKIIMAMLHLPLDQFCPDNRDRSVGVAFGPSGAIKETQKSQMSVRQTASGSGNSSVMSTSGVTSVHINDEKVKYYKRPGIPSRINPSVPRPREAEVKARAIRRGITNERKKVQAEKLKEKGNNVFRAGTYQQAADLYMQASQVYKPLPVYMNNLAAALLKLERWDEAEVAADHATLIDPQLMKGFFRRGMARKSGHLKKVLGAARGFQRCLDLDPTCAEAKAELEACKNDPEFVMAGDESGDDSDSDVDYSDMDSDIDNDAVFLYGLGRDFAPGRTVHVLDCPSDTEDHHHKGNKLPCRYYNHEGCQFGKVCRYMHAPDNRSIRDELGRNVCLHFLVDRCKFGKRCWYTHDKTYLPSNGWWNDMEGVEDYQEFYDGLKKDLKQDGAMDNLGSAMNGTAMPWAIHAKWRALFKEIGNKFTGFHDDEDWYDDESDDEDFYQTGRPSGSRGRGRANNFGFTEDDVNELLCQGVMPWDDDAQAVLGVLNSY
ncbi:hypothetical protein BDP27DRAFT_1295616 [Rhodocollybia butyracea]|uniref:C3H1-type domain-containing protein n=1 Tax=Rhodocollybia butyracea TaxID=206335 RepID=A0A9P5PLQ7_9AGAR|nr:hypothetical protein BDP27DRAFT_1295616 [Rhodocollybia butyracea]